MTGIAGVVNKTEILGLLQARLEGELQTLIVSATAAHEAATNEESKPEDQYDTRGLEASYLAGAQAQRAAELQQMLLTLKYFKLQEFKPQDSISASALVRVRSDKAVFHYFLIPGAAGHSVTCNGVKIQMIAPQSPLGEELMGRKVGDQFEIEGKDSVREYEILEVS